MIDFLSRTRYGSEMRSWRRLVATTAVIGVLVATVPQYAYATTTTGTSYWPLFGSDATWLTWNSTASTQTITSVGVTLPPRSALIESNKSGTTNYCVDAIWDWKVNTGHYDSRVLRNCSSGLWQWQKSEAAPSGWTFQGENKHAACYLSDPYDTGRTGSNVTGIQRKPGACVGFSNQGNESLNTVQTVYPSSPVNPVCADAKIRWGATLLTLTSTDRRSCTS